MLIINNKIIIRKNLSLIINTEIDIRIKKVNQNNITNSTRESKEKIVIITRVKI